jgi:hypothetical protein
VRLLPRLRLEMARRPWIYWLAVTLAAGTAAASTLTLTNRLDAERARWGTPVEVLVARHDIAPGDAFDGAVSKRSYPAAMVPASAATNVADGAVARRHVGSGVIVTRADMAADSTPRSLLEPGQLAVAVVEHVRAGARVGDRVTVVSDGLVLAAHAPVIGADTAAVVLAVDAASAPLVAAAAAVGSISLLIEP